MKRIIFLGVLALILGVLVACGGEESDSTGGEAEESSIVGDDIEGATELTAETYPFDQMHNNLLLALQSDSGAPDIADIEIAKFPNYLQGDIQLEPLNDYIEPKMDNFVPERLELYAKDGNYYGAPTHL